jgi:hypothetical protein
MYTNKMKTNKYHTVRTILNIKIAERGNVDTSNTKIYDFPGLV